MTRRLTPTQRVALAALVRQPLHRSRFSYRFADQRNFSGATIQALEELGLARRIGKSAFATALGLQSFRKAQRQ